MGTQSDMDISHRIEQLEQELAQLREKSAEQGCTPDKPMACCRIFHNHSAVMYLVDKQTLAIVEANAAACRFYGYPRDAFTAMRLPDLNNLSEGETTRLIEDLAGMGGGEPARKQPVCEHVLAGGERRMVELHGGHHACDGREHVLVVENDVAGVKQTEKQLRESQQKFTAAFHQGPAGHAIVGAHSGEVLEANEHWLQVHAVERDEAVGVPIFLLGVWSQEQWLIFQEIVLSHSLMDNMEFPFHRSDGQTGAGLYSASLADIGDKQCILVSMLDITNRFEAEKRLLAREARYRAIVQDQSEMIFRRDIEGRLTFVNQAYARYFGKTRKECLEENFRPQIPAEDAARLEKLTKTLTPQRPAATYEHRIILPGGAERWQQWTSRALFDTHGNVAGYQSVGKDISERKQAEDALAALNRQLEGMVAERTRELENKAAELEEAVERLQELDRMKSIFLSSVSHELRTPLTSMLGFAKLILKDFNKHFGAMGEGSPFLAAKGRRIVKNLDIIRHEGERLTRLVRDVLDLARIEDGRMQWREDVFPLRQLAEKAADAVRPMFSLNEDVAFKVRVDIPRTHIRADLDRLVQVLINLLNNAGKFTEKGSVQLDVFLSDEGTVRMVVSDTGPGILEEQKEKIFDKFFQARHNDTVNIKHKGAGLGLAISQNIVEHYQGSIRVESTVGKGSSFIVDLPKTLIVSKPDAVGEAAAC